MTFEEAKVMARQGIKMTHTYFTQREYMTMQGNQLIFEDGVKIFADEWVKGKDYLLQGWTVYQPFEILKVGTRVQVMDPDDEHGNYGKNFEIMGFIDMKQYGRGRTGINYVVHDEKRREITYLPKQLGILAH